MDLEIPQHPKFQRREWRFTRFGWAFIALFLLAGLIGLLGAGPLSWATARSETGQVEVDYQRIGHLDTEDLLAFTIDAGAVSGESTTVVLHHDWVQAVDITGIVPQPDSQAAGPDGLQLEISSVPGTSIFLRLRYRPTDMGPTHFSATVGSETAGFNQFIIP